MTTLAYSARALPRWLLRTDETFSEALSATAHAPHIHAPPPAEPDVFRKGALLEGKYEIRGLLGAGGMSQVFEAHDRALNRLVAIKVAWPHVGPEALRREAQVLAAFRHPGLVAAHALGTHEGHDFLVMERLSGQSLAARLVALHPETLPLVEALGILLAVSETLAVLHESGLAHSDLKPPNIMLSPGRVVLLDFGIVRIEQIRGDDGRISGSPHYMAPEVICSQVQPGRAHLVDLYALGVIAFLLVSGRPPFDHEKPEEIMRQHVQEEPPPLSALRPELPAGLERLVEQLLAKHPDDRPDGVDEVRAGLKRLHRKLGG